MKQPYRTDFGEQFNEGARLAWIAKDAAGLSNAELARRVECHRSHLGKILYGDMKPGRALAARFFDVLGVPHAAWDQPPSEEFVLPAARPEESGPTLPDVDATGTETS